MRYSISRNPDCLLVLLFLLCQWPLGIIFAAEPLAKGIQDNSFLVEEAYNQEEGVVQHISSPGDTRQSDAGLAHRVGPPGDHRLPACGSRQLAETLFSGGVPHFASQIFDVAGRLPATTGWQPVIPGIPRSASRFLNLESRFRSSGISIKTIRGFS